MFNKDLVNQIRGRAQIAKYTDEDVDVLLKIIDWFEAELDVADENDMFGTEGWKHFFGVED